VLQEIMAVVDYYKLPFESVLDMAADVFGLHLAWIQIVNDRRKHG